MRPLVRLLAAVCAFQAVLVAPTAAQDVLIVDQAGGPGVFTTLGAAVAAAQEGDVLLVKQGAYFEDLVIDGKSLVVQEESGANVLVRRIQVQNLGPTQFVAVRGLDWDNSHELSLGLLDNQGPVWIEDAGHVDLAPFFESVGGYIVNCSSVVLRDCRFAGGGRRRPRGSRRLAEVSGGDRGAASGGARRHGRRQRRRARLSDLQLPTPAHRGREHDLRSQQRNALSADRIPGFQRADGILAR